MKTAVTVLAIVFALAFTAPAFAEDVAVKTLCDPKKMEECQTKIDGLIQSLEVLKTKLQRTQMEIKAGRKLSSAEADRMLEKMDSINQTLPKTEGFMWDN